jgi:hypothetical protein
MEYSKLPIVGQLEQKSIDYGIILVVVGIFLAFLTINYLGITETKAITFIFYTAPLWLPYVTFYILYDKWLESVGHKYTYEQGRTYLEIVLPPVVTKSPEAMEFVFTQIHNVASIDNLMQSYLDGKRPLPYTFELVSRGGDVHFYATIPAKFVQNFKDNLYAQYPGIEVVELKLDYTAEVPNSLENWFFMSFWMNKKEADVLPIRTYIDFKMDQMPKEEEKVDPITPMLEAISSIGPGQQVWIQFICVAHRKKNFKNGHLEAKPEWTKDAAKKINEIMQRDPKTRIGLPEMEGAPRLTQGERDTVVAIERNTSKYAYETGIRWCYLFDQSVGKFDPGLIARVNRAFAATESKTQNGISVQGRTDFDYKFFADPFGKKLPAMKRDELKYYKKRSMYPMKSKVFSAEELATLWHPPGLVAVTPTLNRVTSTRAEAPSNLPTGQLPI